MHENLETSGMPVGNEDSRPAGEGNSHTVRAHVFEGSDSGIVPMNRSNKGGQPLAESEEGRPLIKENTHQSRTHPAQSGARVSQGLAGVRHAEYRLAAKYPRYEPYALMSARTDLCGGYQATGIPTATSLIPPSRSGLRGVLVQREKEQVAPPRTLRLRLLSPATVRAAEFGE